jgi:hypothetical protein
MDNVQMWSDVEHILQSDRLVFVLQKKIKNNNILYIQGVAQLTPQRKLTCADSNNITGKTDSFFLSAFLIDLEAYQIHQSR